MQSGDLDAEDVPPWFQIRGNGNVVLRKTVQTAWPPVRNTERIYLSSVVPQLVDGPDSSITLLKDL